MSGTNLAESDVDTVAPQNILDNVKPIKEVEFSLVFNKDRYSIKFDADKKISDLKVHIESLTSTFRTFFHLISEIPKFRLISLLT
jgi:hypothetical protein